MVALGGVATRIKTHPPHRRGPRRRTVGWSLPAAIGALRAIDARTEPDVKRAVPGVVVALIGFNVGAAWGGIDRRTPARFGVFDRAVEVSMVTACVTTSCTNHAATTTAPLASTTTAAPPMTPTAVVGPSSIGAPHSGGAFPIPPPGTCHLGSVAGQPMPDEHCSPGATKPAVTQGTINETICKSGSTATVRPPVAITDAIKAHSARAYGIAAGELDHKIALEVGGNSGTAGDVANLWFEPGPIPNPKDTVERVLNHGTCAGLIILAAAQTVINHSWPTAVTDAGLQVAVGRVCLRAEPSRCIRA